MSEILAFCGLLCNECAAYLATVANDDEQKKAIASQWSREFGAEINPEDINCLGCSSVQEPLFNYCRICEIRKCAIVRNLPNCAACPDYGCQKLRDFQAHVPAAKERLEAIRISLG